VNIERIGFDSTLSRFAEEAKRFPMLTAEDERAYALAWRDQRDRRALERLVGSHLRFVLKIARGYRGYGLPLADLVAEGNVGLMQAAEKFDPEKGFRFATYAMWWIKAAIQEYVLRSASLVKMGTTAAQKKLFFNLRRMKARRDALDAGDMTPEDVESIAAELGVPAQDVIEMNRRLAAVDASLDAPGGVEGEPDRISLWGDATPSLVVRLAHRDELVKRRRLMGAAMERLDPRERRIIEARRLRDEPSTLEELSHEFNVSRERVRQLEVRAFEKLRKAMMAANDGAVLPVAA
jgi:RNA polymerase sigma-32 factor